MAQQPPVRSRALAVCALATLALTCLPACAGGPSGRSQVTVKSGERTRLLLAQAGATQPLQLQNASAAAAREVYSDAQSDKGLKVIDDEQMQKLLDVLADNGFFAHAVPLPAGDAKETIAIEQHGKTWVWSRRPFGPSPIEEITAFGTAKAYVLSVYNSATSFHAQKGITGDALEREKSRIEQSSKAAKEKAQNQGKQEAPPRQAPR